MSGATRFRPAIDIFVAGVAATSIDRHTPLLHYDAAREVLVVGRHELDARNVGRIAIIGAGKAAWPIVGALFGELEQSALPMGALTALTLVPGSAEGDPPGRHQAAGRDAESGREIAWEVLKVRPPDANEPTEQAVAATERVLAIARSLGQRDLLICAFTGGGSALLCAPAPGLALDDKLEAVRDLTADGATIEELNTLRRHLSAVKGGQLAQAASRARAVVSLLVSDVDGDDAAVIASGPTAHDPSTFADALALREEWPPNVLRHLERGVRGEIPETPASLPPCVSNHVIVTPSEALVGASVRAEAMGWKVAALPRPTPASLVACVALHLDAIRRAPGGTAILSVGEAPLPLPPFPPKGGRAGHLALAIALAVDADPGLRGRVTVLVGATDGEDGTSGTHGGVVDEAVLRQAERAGADPARLLDRCESLRVLEAGGGTLTGRVTRTNVQDLRVILVSPSS